MAYSTQMAAALSGATTGQIRSWRQDRGSGPFLQPELASRPKALYSFRDVFALRAFARLREDFSLQSLRRAVGNLRQLGELDHLSTYSLVADGKSIALYGDDDHSTDLLKQPGQRVIATLDDIMQPFSPRPGVVVPHLLRPNDNVSVDPDTQGGQPVVTGTRVPIDDVAALLRDGIPADRISDYYPSVNAAAARDAERFALYIDSYSSGGRAA
ncbi:DUF433 domain-containing protein [Streptomyces sp. CB03911]|uniref:DUF433 domain-containing protein n=1 Tax=Streptomyces sp. CB03911 TaxID=1804758 RepID=UPI00093D14FC|nr:DUF433 domain-containing protein [Streptomyces sp. CB03911]OKI22190.1 hypothetical protein A6A07_34510 [Streptomyces sp. CB03911]